MSDKQKNNYKPIAYAAVAIVCMALSAVMAHLNIEYAGWMILAGFVALLNI